MSEGFDGFLNEPSISRHRPHACSSRLLSTTSAPLMPSVSRDSRSSEAASDHLQPNGNFLQENSKLSALLTLLLDASGEQSIDTVRSSPGSSTSHPPLDLSSSTGQRRTLKSDATSPLLDTAVTNISQAVISSVAKYLKAGTLDEAQIIVHTKLSNLFCSQTSSQRLVRSESSNQPAAPGGQIQCDMCPKSLARSCDMKYVHSRSNLKFASNNPTGSTRSGTPSPTAAPFRLATRSSAARTTGNVTRTLSISSSNAGGVTNRIPAVRSVTARRSSTAVKNLRNISNKTIRR